MSSDHQAEPSEEVLSGHRPTARRNLFYPKREMESLLQGWGAFGLHQPAFDQFPFPVWSALVDRHTRNPAASALHRIDPMGAKRFRQELCAYLRTARAVKCDPEQIMSDWPGPKRDKWLLAARTGPAKLFDVDHLSSKSLLAFKGLPLCGIWQATPDRVKCRSYLANRSFMQIVDFKPARLKARCSRTREVHLA